MENLLLNAQKALRANDVSSARILLRLQVGRYPDDPAGWYLLSQVTDQPAEGIECLQQVLQIATRHLPGSVENISPIVKPPGPVHVSAKDLPPKPQLKTMRRLLNWASAGINVLMGFRLLILVPRIALVASTLKGWLPKPRLSRPGSPVPRDAPQPTAKTQAQRRAAPPSRNPSRKGTNGLRRDGALQSRSSLSAKPVPRRVSPTSTS